MKLWLECKHCKEKFEIREKHLVCPDCSKTGEHYELTVCYDYDQISEQDKKALLSRPRDMWGFRCLLPVTEEMEPVTLGEGATPLTRVLSAAKRGYGSIWCKNESQNPTWSHKDRLNSVLATISEQFGCSNAVCSSTGNHGLSVAAYAARAGYRSIILFPPETPKLMVDLASSYGALSIITQWNARGEMLRHLCARGWFPFTSPKDTPTSNPYGLEGYKTIAYEMVGDLGRAPDKVFVPVASGALIYGVYKGFVELHRLGLIESIPQIVACQAKGANVMQRAFNKGEREMEVLPHAYSLATSTREESVENKALEAVYGSKGSVKVASDYEIQQAMIAVAKEGYCAEAASAIPFACLFRMLEEGQLEKDECCVCILTSGGVKSPDILSDLRRPAVRIEGTIEALDEAVSRYDSSITSGGAI